MEKWFVKNKKADFESIMNKFKVSEVLARMLVNRGLTKESEIEKYLEPDFDKLYDSYMLKDAKKSCEILKKKIEEKKKIRIVGDYDVDGIMSTYLFYIALKKCGASVDYEIPDRMIDGYGISLSIIEKAKEEEIDTILTCDNGIAAVEQIEYAKKVGMTVIVTDHHDIPFEELETGRTEIFPNADTIVNPKQKECKYPYSNLCGAAVAFKVIEILYDMFEYKKEEWKKLIQYVAIATVCDVMDLTDENRIIVKLGLAQLRQVDNKGLAELMDITGVDKEKLSSYHLGFVVGPCLNASGRLKTAKLGLELLLEENKSKAAKLASELKNLNDIRKDMTNLGVEQATNLANSKERVNDKVLVLVVENCHESLAGIIAGRIREKFYKPTIIITKAKEGSKGSGRSIESYNMFEEISKCKELLMRFGGHPMAAGISLETENIEEFRKKVNENTKLTEEDLMPKVSIDAVMPLGYVKEELVEELKILEPFGKENPKPVFAEKDLILHRGDILGKNKNVVKLKVENKYKKEMVAMYFGDVEKLIGYIDSKYGEKERTKLFSGVENNVKLSVTYYPEVNEYKGYKTMQIIIQNYQ